MLPVGRRLEAARHRSQYAGLVRWRQVAILLLLDTRGKKCEAPVKPLSGAGSWGQGCGAPCEAARNSSRRILDLGERTECIHVFHGGIAHRRHYV
jgi:hypothetical protein